MKRFACLVMALIAMLAFAGCNVASEMPSYLKPPRLTGEQQAVQEQLDRYLAEQKQSQESRLKYPKSGENRSAILIADINGDDVDEAIAFYNTAQDETVRVHVMRRDKNNEWKSHSDIVGNSTEIEEVALADINGDGGNELLIGWSLYTSLDKQLTVYTDTPDGTVSSVGDLLYTAFYVGDITDFERDDLLVFRADTATSSVTVTLETIERYLLKTVSTARLDGYVQGFRDIQPTSLADGVNALYIDCYRDPNTQLTELVYWDGEQLVSPLYNPNTNLTIGPVREVAITAKDVDGDGVVEVPTCRRLPGYETAVASASMWLTEWSHWVLDGQILKTETAFYSIINLQDGYYFRIPDKYVTVGESGEVDISVSAAYDAATREWSLYTVEDGRLNTLLFTIRAVPMDAEEDEDGTDARKFKQVAQSNAKKTVYKAWINDLVEDNEFTVRKVTYQISLW